MQVRAGVALALVVLLLGCGGGEQGTHSSGGAGATPPPAPQGADVSITVSGPGTAVAAGASTAFEIVVDNAGPDVARNVLVSPSVAAGLNYTGFSCTASGGATCPTSGNLGVVSLPVQGRLHFVLQTAVGHLQRGLLEVSAVVSADNERDLINTAGSAAIEAYQADLYVSAQGPTGPVTSGGAAVYTMGVSNTGPDTARNVQLDNVVGAGQTLRSVTCGATGGAVCPATPGTSMLVPLIPVGGHSRSP